MSRLRYFRSLIPCALTIGIFAQTSGTQAVVTPLAEQLIAMAGHHDADLGAAIKSAFDPKQLQAGTAAIGLGPDFFFAIEAHTQPVLTIDGKMAPAMQQAGRDGPWYAVAHVMPVGRPHAYSYLVNGNSFGGSNDLGVYGPLSYVQPGVPSGVLSAKLVHTSKIYDGMKSDYWIYVPAQYDPKVPAALMVFQDGAGYINRNGGHRALNVIDNLIAQKKIPVMISVFISPGTIDDSPGTPTYLAVKSYSDKWHRTLKDSMRSHLYDSVSGRYSEFLENEILATVGAQYNIRSDAYSRGITGSSSGGICAFNAAWQAPGHFSRVISWIGSFTGIQWKETPGLTDGGQDYPEKVLREDQRNIRVWLQDGANDMENEHYGSWPLANIRMANALKTRGYDFHFSFGAGTHNQAHGASMFPEEMVWLWRDYDAAKTEQTYQMESLEKAKPLFRVAIVNRDAN